MVMLPKPVRKLQRPHQIGKALNRKMNRENRWTMKKFKTVTVDGMDELLSVDGALLLDCRQAKDYKVGHIDNALNSHDALVESLLRKTEKDKNIVIYCYHGHSSEHLAELFANFGFTAVYSVEGGYEKWLEAQKAH